MSGRRVQHLVERGRGFQVRLPVPVDLQQVLDRKELRWSVRTREPKVAAKRALNATLAFQRLCDKLRLMKDLCVDDARNVARAFYQKLAESYRSPPPIADNAFDHEPGHQEAMAEEMIAGLEHQVQARSFRASIAQQAMAEAQAGGFQMPPPGSEAFRALCEGIARAQIEHARFTLYRQGNLLGSYQPQDELFHSLPKAAVLPPDPELQSIAIDPGMSLQEAVAKHLAAFSTGPQSWGRKTREEKQRTFKMVMAVWGVDLPVSQISTAHVRDVRDFIQALKPHSKLDLQKPSRMSAKDGDERLNPKTASKYFGYVRSLLIWLDAEGYLESVPGSSIRLATPKVGVKKSVLAFKPEQLNKVFGSPLYAGAKSPLRLHLPGSYRTQNGIYWMYLLALHTGMREGELLQLRKSDVLLDVELPHIDISEELDLKTATSVRKVPIHPDLLAYGLAGWIAARPKKAEERLFYEIKLGAEGHRTSAASKKLNNYLKRIGVKKGRKLVFHSLRHNFMDATRNAGVPYERAKQLVGHRDATVSGGYGEGANLQTLAKQVGKIDFGLSKEVRAMLIGNAKI
tara:strand:+ start:76 stop:1788 length:1713 start_codon:yes stop_codon:yes gene_type:complete